MFLSFSSLAKKFLHELTGNHHEQARNVYPHMDLFDMRRIQFSKSIRAIKIPPPLSVRHIASRAETAHRGCLNDPSTVLALNRAKRN